MREKRKIIIISMMIVLMVMALATPADESHVPVSVPDMQDVRSLAVAPVNDATPACTNLDDTTFMYPRLRSYLITVNVSDADGYTDISWVDFSLLDAADNSTLWTVRYTNSTDTFSETAGTTLIELVTGSSSSTRAGNDIDLTIAAKIEWIHGDYLDTNCRSTVYDGVTTTMDNYTSTNWDVETDLDFTGLTISDDRGNPSATLTVAGTVIYSGSVLNPPSAEVDVWCIVPTGLTDQSDLTLSAGAFSITTVPSKSTVSLNTYTIKTVAEGGGAAGTDLSHATHTVTYISDRLTVEFTVDDSNPRRSDTITFTLTITYQYDSTTCSSFSVAITRDGVAWDTATETTISESVSTRGVRVYSVYTVTDDTYGITSFSAVSDITVTWRAEGGVAPQSDVFGLGFALVGLVLIGVLVVCVCVRVR